jgi:PKD repeat protein
MQVVFGQRISQAYAESPLNLYRALRSLNPSPYLYFYDFGDSTTQTLNFDFIPGQAEGTADTAPTPGNVTKTYTTPGVYDLTLTVSSPYGVDTIVLPKYIEARTKAPDVATIVFDPLPTQQLIGSVLKTKINTPVSVSILSNGEQSLDPISSYNWNMSDDIPHPNSPNSEGLWSVGGLYDIVLRSNTTFGSFRITTFPNVVDVIEGTNIVLTKSTVENLMQRIDKVDKVYLEEIRKNQIGAVVSAQAAQNIAIMSTKRVVLGALADLLLEFLPKDTE